MSPEPESSTAEEDGKVRTIWRSLLYMCIKWAF